MRHLSLTHFIEGHLKLRNVTQPAQVTKLFEPRSSGQKLTYYLLAQLRYLGVGRERRGLRLHLGLQKCLPHTHTPQARPLPFSRVMAEGGQKRGEEKAEKKRGQGRGESVNLSPGKTLPQASPPPPSRHNPSRVPTDPYGSRATVPR